LAFGHIVDYGLFDRSTNRIFDLSDTCIAFTKYGYLTRIKQTIFVDLNGYVNGGCLVALAAVTATVSTTIGTITRWR